jgi:hypothetical protein
MPSSKGKPTDPKLREQVKEDVKQETNKDGGGKGQMSAWKVCSRDGSSSSSSSSRLALLCSPGAHVLTRCAGSQNLQGVREEGRRLRERSGQQERSEKRRAAAQVGE